MHFHFCGEELAAITASIPLLAGALLWVRTRASSVLARLRSR